MAPKASLTQAQKLQKVLAFFHESGTCHTLKDLEVSVPTATKINKMQIKDLIRELTDTNLVKVEKIGSGNWYWAWAGEELAEKESLRTSLAYVVNPTPVGIADQRSRAEYQEVEKSVQQIQTHISSARAQRSQDLDHPEYESLVAETNELDTLIKALTVSRDAWETAIVDGVDSKQRAVDENRLHAIRQADNIYALEEYLLRQLSVSSEELEMIRRDCYGPLYQSDNDFVQFDES